MSSSTSSSSRQKAPNTKNSRNHLHTLLQSNELYNSLPQILSIKPSPPSKKKLKKDESGCDARAEMSKLRHDLELLFEGTSTRGTDHEGYSSGSTYFICAKSEPRCFLEALALRIFRLHVSGDGSFDPSSSGVEFWTLVMNDDDDDDDEKEEDEEEGCDVGLHFDADYGLEDEGVLAHPLIATVTYFSDYGVPTCIFDITSSKVLEAIQDINTAPSHGTSATVPVNKMFASAPAFGKHCYFEGSLLHGAPASIFPSPVKRDENNVLSGSKGDRIRMTFLANIWLDHKPMDAIEVDELMISKMMLDANVFDNEMGTIEWLEKVKTADENCNFETKTVSKQTSNNIELVEADIAGRSCEMVFSACVEQLRTICGIGESTEIILEDSVCKLLIGDSSHSDVDSDDD